MNNNKYKVLRDFHVLNGTESSPLLGTNSFYFDFLPGDLIENNHFPSSSLNNQNSNPSKSNSDQIDLANAVNSNLPEHDGVVLQEIRKKFGHFSSALEQQAREKQNLPASEEPTCFNDLEFEDPDPEVLAWAMTTLKFALPDNLFHFPDKWEDLEAWYKRQKGSNKTSASKYRFLWLPKNNLQAHQIYFMFKYLGWYNAFRVREILDWFTTDHFVTDKQFNSTIRRTFYKLAKRMKKIGFLHFKKFEGPTSISNMREVGMYKACHQPDFVYNHVLQDYFDEVSALIHKRQKNLEKLEKQKEQDEEEQKKREEEELALKQAEEAEQKQKEAEEAERKREGEALLAITSKCVYGCKNPVQFHCQTCERKVCQNHIVHHKTCFPIKNKILLPKIIGKDKVIMSPQQIKSKLVQI